MTICDTRLQAAIVRDGCLLLVQCTLPGEPPLKALGYEYRGQFDDESGHYYAVRDSGGIRFC
jgi:hypothetical protein